MEIWGDIQIVLTLNQLPLYTDDFFFLPKPTEGGIIKEELVICNPQDAICISPVVLRSRKSLEEHIEFVNQKQIKKALIIAENIEFIRRCPSLEYITVIPSLSAENFDFSPLYDLPNIKVLFCHTMYGEDEKKISHIDYSKIKGLRQTSIDGKGHLNYDKVKGLKTVYFGKYQPAGDSLEDVLNMSELEYLDLCQSSVRTLNGMEKASKLKKLHLSYCRKLDDISALSHVGKTLRELTIDTCGKITDFSAFFELRELERLSLIGTNVIPNLDFLSQMPNLKAFKCFMTIEDGKMGLLKNVPWVMFKGKKHYDYKEKDFTQISVSYSDDFYCEFE